MFRRRRLARQYYVNQAVCGGAERPELKGMRCASVNGFSLHANTDVAAHRRDQLERLLRYTASGAVSLERLTQDASGDLLYRFTRAWSDGTTGIKLSPLELIEKLSALVPPPHAQLVARRCNSSCDCGPLTGRFSIPVESDAFDMTVSV